MTHHTVHTDSIKQPSLPLLTYTQVKLEYAMFISVSQPFLWSGNLCRNCDFSRNPRA